jgi:hypothetical protein
MRTSLSASHAGTIALIGGRSARFDDLQHMRAADDSGIIEPPLNGSSIGGDNMKKLSFALVFAAVAAFSSGCIIESDDDEDSSLTIANESNFVLVDIRVAEIDNPDYGPNLIPEDLLPGEEITIFLDCDVYDVLIEDQLGAVCELLGLDLCFDDAIWVIDDAQLAACDF